ncbi:hypothetical protein GH714_006062 [Hevea brasiliensis]|uniref:PGG domain-containing protein n=1 Tax=Hevea brasiliensis TaxID=3981 RepID=A0A6A6MC41_HEVBR|nr:hypothetical protein GH714_006062 [Hevea brasiliensis]
MAECNGPLTATLNEDGETALHIATAASQTHFVKMLVGKISREDLAIETIPPDPTETPNTNAARAPPLVEPMAAAATTSQIVADPNMGTAQQENDQATAIVTIVRQVEDPIQATPAVSQSEDQGQQPKENGNTAFCYAALSGNVKIAQIMMRKNDALPTKRGRQNFLPIYMAALAGQAEMVRELYNHHQANEKDKLEDDDLISLLIALVESDIYDIALKMIRERPKLATMKDKDGKTSALHAFAEKPCIPSIQTSSGIWSYCINFLLNKDKRKQGLDLVEKLWEEVISYNDDEVSRFMNVPSGRLIFIAAENGNVEFLAKLICKYPDLVLKVDDNQHTIFHKAILNRHEKIFMLIFELGMMKTLIEICEDKDGNNMLHLAGKMPQEESRVNVVPGAALQLQRELQWFEVVKKVVRPGQIAAKNVDGKTPRDVFMKEHKELREAAEKWMINTANSCMLVATLIATVVFAAALPYLERMEYL